MGKGNRSSEYNGTQIPTFLFSNVGIFKNMLFLMVIWIIVFLLLLFK